MRFSIIRLSRKGGLINRCAGFHQACKKWEDFGPHIAFFPLLCYNLSRTNGAHFLYKKEETL